MIFVIEPSKSVFETNPPLKMTEHLSKLSNKEVKWIALVYDYDSPLSQMPTNIRKIKAGIMTGWEMVNGLPDKPLQTIMDGGNDKVNLAIEEYKTLQFDENKEALIAFNDQLRQYRTFLKQPEKKASELKLALEIQQKLPVLLRARDEIVKIVGMRANEDDFNISNVEGASAIDKVVFEEESLKDNEH